MFTLAVDLGASFIKAGLFDKKSKQLLISRRDPFPPFLETLGLEREVPLQPILEIVDRQIKDLLGSVSQAVDLWISNQMQGFVLVDPVSKEASGNFISWQDQRSLSVWKEIEGIYTPAILKSIGNELRVGHAATTLFAMNKKKNVLTGLMPISLGDFLVMHLTGEMGEIHETNASGFGCLSLKNSNWDEQLIKNLQLKGVIFPKVVKRFSPKMVGSKLRVWGAIGDFQAALLGVGLREDKALSINVATGSQVARIVSDVPDKYDGQLRPYFGGKLLNCITHLPAGRAINFLVSHFECLDNKTVEDLFRNLDQNMSATTSLVVNLRFFSSGDALGGSITNIREDNFSSKNLLMAALNFMSENYFSCRGRIDPERQCTYVLGSGGILTKSKYFQRLLERKMGLPVTVPSEKEDALLGLIEFSDFNE